MGGGGLGARLFLVEERIEKNPVGDLFVGGVVIICEGTLSLK